MSKDAVPPPRLWIIAGAGGFLGNTLVRTLLTRGEDVRAVELSATNPSLDGLGCEVVVADITDPGQVRDAFVAPAGLSTIVVHCAGVVSIAGKVSAAVRAVNVEGTSNVIEACRETGFTRLVYVSSVHAIPEPDPPSTITELDDPAAFEVTRVVGENAQTKAEATAF